MSPCEAEGARTMTEDDAQAQAHPRFAGGEIRAAVVGDEHVGKTSLIIAALTDSYTEEPPPVMQPTRLPQDLLPDREPMTVSDTSSKAEWRDALKPEVVTARGIIALVGRKL